MRENLYELNTYLVLVAVASVARVSNCKLVQLDSVACSHNLVLMRDEARTCNSPMKYIAIAKFGVRKVILVMLFATVIYYVRVYPVIGMVLNLP